MQFHEVPAARAAAKPRNPIAICAFNGWNDAGESATGTITHLMNHCSAHLVAQMQSEDFYDYQQNRPTIFMDNSQIRRITWPNTHIYLVNDLHTERDIVFVIGPEPSFKWQAFTDELIDLFEDLGVELVITLGSLLADTPHTRPISITGSSTDLELSKRFSYQPSRYEGPTGIVGVLQSRAQERELAAISLWAAIPHYAASAPSPKATLALIEELGELVERELPIGDLAEASKAWEIAVSQLAEEDAEISEYVKQLEVDKDDSDFEETTGDELAKEFERYLRKQKDN